MELTKGPNRLTYFKFQQLFINLIILIIKPNLIINFNFRQYVNQNCTIKLSTYYKKVLV